MENITDTYKERKFDVLIVDDELYARRLLTEYVMKLPFLNLVAPCADAFEATLALKQHQVDIMFLDIQMPEMSGLELARNLVHPPAIIFTTAYSEYAIESYELDAADYLLKPIEFSRFFKAIERAIAKMPNAANISADDDKESLLQTDLVREHIIVKSGHKLYKINFSDLCYVEGQRESVIFHTLTQKITAYYSLKKLEEELPFPRFVRVHKSFIAAFKHMETIEGNMLTVSGKVLPIGGNFRDGLLALFSLN